jgi:putative transcriptional regulator
MPIGRVDDVAAAIGDRHDPAMLRRCRATMIPARMISMPYVATFLRFRRALLALAALALPALLAGAVAPTVTEPSGPPSHQSLTGQLLIASPDMRDPRFDHAVVLVVKHDRDGALGIVINKPVGERPLAEILAALGEKREGDANVPLFIGGPVQLDVMLVLHSAEYRVSGTLAVDGHVAVTGDPQVLRDIAAKTGPQKSLLAFGYAGWAAGQLDAEMEHNVWFTAPEDPTLLFDADRDKVWDLAMARRTRDL